MSITRVWAERWRAEPGRPVLWTAATGWLTGAALDEASASAARRLAGAGVETGDRVLLSGPPSAELAAAYIGILRLGATVVPANTAYTDRELAHIVGDTSPRAAVLGSPRSLDVPLVTSVDLPLADPGGEIPLDKSDGPALIGFTSGTTGAPKGAVLSHGNLLAGARAVVSAWAWTEEDLLVSALPLFHMHGLGVALNGTLTAGARIALLPRFGPDEVFDALALHEATLFFGVPTMYARLAASPRLKELAPLRLAVSGSAPLPADLWQTVSDASGQRVLERYGMSETVMLTSNPYDGDRRPGTVGLPLPGVELRLGEGGGVEVRGPNVFAGYWQRPAESAATFTPDGFFRTGDVGELSDDGYLTLVGRKSELIITGGFNVYPREVEDVLRGHPAIEDVAVVGRADPEWGETVVAYCVGTPVPDDELVGYCADLLAAFKRPRRWRWVDELPRNAMGKVVRSALS